MHGSRNGQKYNLLQDGGLVKGYPWRIWVIIDTPHPALLQDRGLVKGYPCRIWVIIDAPHPACRKRRLGGSSGISNRQYCDRWCAWIWNLPPPMSFQGVTSQPISESAIPDNGKVGNPVICPLSWCFGVLFWCI